MKRIVGVFLSVVGSLILAAAEDFKIILEPRWQNLDSNILTTDHFDGKWILIGSITFKKKAKEAVNLQRIYLRWKGEKIDSLLGSLYRKSPDKEFLAIEENLICDGRWNSAQQTLMLDFDEQQSLGLVNIFYLVLTVPEKLEGTVKKGSFDIVHSWLPEPFQPNRQKTLSLSLDALGSTTTE